MAKNQNEDIDLVNDMDLDDEEEKDGKKNGKMMTSIVALFIVLIWVAIFALLIKLDVGGFGSSVMYPVLKTELMNLKMKSHFTRVMPMIMLRRFLICRQNCQDSKHTKKIKAITSS